uniref:Uncharacterized protein n=1 Tax=Oryza brachyantha TaxID=4533 RepID=J3N4X6_ORYBR
MVKNFIFFCSKTTQLRAGCNIGRFAFTLLEELKVQVFASRLHLWRPCHHPVAAAVVAVDVAVHCHLHGVDYRRRGRLGRRGGDDDGLDGPWHAGGSAASDERPVDALEEGVLLDLRRAALHAEPGLRLLGQQAPDQVPAGVARRRVVREPELLPDDVEQRRPVRLPLERRLAVHELVQEHAERPPVHRAAVALPLDDLRRQVLVRPHERHRPRAGRLHDDLRQRRGQLLLMPLPRLAALGPLALLAEQLGHEARRLDASSRLGA